MYIFVIVFDLHGATNNGTWSLARSPIASNSIETEGKKVTVEETEEESEELLLNDCCCLKYVAQSNCKRCVGCPVNIFRVICNGGKVAILPSEFVTSLDNNFQFTVFFDDDDSATYNVTGKPTAGTRSTEQMQINKAEGELEIRNNGRETTSTMNQQQ